MDPKLLMEMSQILRDLSPQQLNRMQTLMHNMMGGLDVSQEMAEFERTLPFEFRQRLMAVMGKQPGLNLVDPIPAQSTPVTASTQFDEEPADQNMNVNQARLTILQAVADGRIPPEEAEKLLFA